MRKSLGAFDGAYHVSLSVNFWTVTCGITSENKYPKGNRKISVITRACRQGLSDVNKESIIPVAQLL